MQHFVLTRLRIQNLACFGDLELRPGVSTLLLGRNGAGKSTLLDVLFELNSLVNGPHDGDDPGFPGYQIHDGTAHIELEVCSSRHRFRYALTLRRAAGLTELSLGPTGPAWVIARECLWDGDLVLTSFVEGKFSVAGAESAVDLVQDRSPLQTVKFPEGSAVLTFKQWLFGLWLLRLQPARMKASAGEPDDALDVSGENFVGWLLNFRRQRKAMAAIVKAAAPSVDGLTALEFVRAGREYVLVAKFGAKSVDFDALSDGQRCLIVLHAVVVLVRQECTLLLLDEPDAHITSEEILPVLRALQRGAEDASVQLMVASHHPQVIDRMAPDSPWELVQKDGSVSARPFEVDLDMGVPASRHLLLRGRR